MRFAFLIQDATEPPPIMLWAFGHDRGSGSCDDVVAGMVVETLMTEFP